MTFNEQAVIEYVTKQRWYGAKSRSVTHSEVLDSVELRTTDPQFTLELVEMRYETGAHDIYQLLHGDTEIDGLEHPAAARELVHAMRAGLTLQGAEGTVEFRPVEGFAGLGRELLDARPVGGEQSNTSLVFDDELILKVFRRLEPGINPELEMLRFLTEHGFANIAALGGWYAYSGGPLSATLGILQEFVRNGEDGWELALEEIGSAPERFLARLRRLGEVTGEMHTVLGSDSNDPAFCAGDAERRVARPLDRNGRRGDRERVPVAAGGRRAARADHRARRRSARAAPHAHVRGRDREDHPHPRRLPPRPNTLVGRTTG